MVKALPRSLSGIVTLLLLWQVSSCCCFLGGAVSPPVDPIPPSKELAAEMRERVMATKSREGPFVLEISDQELTSYIIGLLQSGAGEFPARDMQIRFGEGYADIWATFVEVAPTDIPAYIRATVEAQDGMMVFHIVEANAGRFPVPGALRETISLSLSETLAELQLGLRVDEIQVAPGKVILSGQVTGEVPDLP